MDLLKLAGLGHCYDEKDRYGWDYLSLVTQPAVASRTGSAVEAVQFVGAALEAIEPVDAEIGDVRDEVVCVGHG